MFLSLLVPISNQSPTSPPLLFLSFAQSQPHPLLLPNPSLAPTAILGVILLFALIRLGLIAWRRFVGYMRGKVAIVRVKVNQRLQWVHKRSVVAATILPHAVFFAVALGLLRWPVAREYMASPSALFFVAIGVPWLWTLSTIFGEEEVKKIEKPEAAAEAATRGETALPASTPQTIRGRFARLVATTPAAVDPPTPATAATTATELRGVNTDLLASQRMWLRHWIVGAVFYALHEIPLVGRLFFLLPFAPQIRLILALWAVMPLVDGAHVLHRGAQRFLERYIGALRSQSEAQRERLGLMQTLATTTVNAMLPSGVRDVVKSVLSGGYVLAVSVPFLFAPRFMTHFGCTIAGCLLPAFLSSKALLLRPEGGVQARQECQKWLVYWAMYVPLILAHEAVEPVLSGLPFWYDAELVAVVALQLPFTNGAQRIFDTFFTGRRIREALATLTPVHFPSSRHGEHARRAVMSSLRRSVAAATHTPLHPQQPPRVQAQNPLSIRLDAAAVAEGSGEDDAHQRQTDEPAARRSEDEPIRGTLEDNIAGGGDKNKNADKNATQPEAWAVDERDEGLRRRRDGGASAHLDG